MKTLLTFLLLTISVGLYAQTAEDYINLGAIKYKIQDYRGAIIDFNNAIELDPTYHQAYYNRGLAKYYLKDYRGAIADYTKAIELNPKHVLAHNNRGNAKRNLQDYQGSIADFNKAIELYSEFAEPYYNRGIAKYNNLKDLDGACLDWSKAGELGYDGAYDMIKKYCN